MDPSDLRLVTNVVERFRVARSVLSERVGEPKELVREFEAALNHILTLTPAEISWAKGQLEQMIKEGWEGVQAPSWPRYDEFWKIAMKSSAAIEHGWPRVHEPGHKLFLAILQTYTLPPALRKKVEIASRAYLKGIKPRYKSRGRLGRYLEWLALYEKYDALWRAHLAIAKEALAKGKEHAEEGEGATKIKVGPFTLVNTGGFNEKQMNEVADVVQKAAAYAQSSGLGDVCYGEVQVTNTISKGNVLAFYLLAKDEMFIRANVKASTDVVRTVLHELGHRYEHKFLKGTSRDVASLYNTLSGQEITRKFDRDKAKAKLPKPGETMVSKGKTYVVVQSLPDFKAGYKIHLHLEEDPRVKAAIAFDGWLAAKGESARDFDSDPNYVGFITEYAKRGGPSENFAEMFAYYCMGRLPVLQSEPFENLVFGTAKTASERLLHRVASRSLG